MSGSIERSMQRKNYVECEKIIRKIDFEKAIAGNETKRSAFESIDIETIHVEKEYDGPHWNEEEEISIDFIEKIRLIGLNNKK